MMFGCFQILWNQGRSRSSVISDHLRPDSSDQPWSSGTRAEVAFFTENNDTINL